MSAVAPATTPAQLLANFRTNTATGVFPQFSRALVANQLQQRISNPFLISQGGSSLCGPASFLYNTAKKSPLTYAKYIVDLYDKGEAKIGNLKVKPGTDCKNNKLPNASLSETDWIGLASLRDSENAILDYDEADDEFAGITLPGELATWYAKSGYTSVENTTNLVFDKSLYTLLQAHQKKQSGHDVSLFVGANVFKGMDGRYAPADHWVVLNSNIEIDGKPVAPLLAKGKSIDDDDTHLTKKIEFKVYTWGNEQYKVDKNHAPDSNNVRVSVEKFLDYFYGYVAAK